MGKNFYKRRDCRLCGSKNLKNVLSLMPTALCDAYIDKAHLGQVQEIYPLELFLCLDCGFVFLPYVVDPKIIYLNYIYVTTSSLGLSEHFRGYAASVLKRVKPATDALVVDLGSNDGTLLKFFKEHGLRVLGVEPAQAIAQDATNRGIETIPDFFNAGLARKIIDKYGRAGLITINNLFANIDDLQGLAKGVAELLAPDGVFIIESSYLGDMMEHMVFDFIYHEHLSYLSIKPLVKFFRRFNMELADIEHVPTKGGSLRYYFQLTGGLRCVSADAASALERENKLKLDQPETFVRFCDKINAAKDELDILLKRLQGEGKKIAGYGASATSTTLIYHFGLKQFLDYLVDDNQDKQDKFSPGYHIPVLASQVLYERKPDYCLLLAWRYAGPIMKKHQAFLKQGGHFILPLPGLKVV